MIILWTSIRQNLLQTTEDITNCLCSVGLSIWFNFTWLSSFTFFLIYYDTLVNSISVLWSCNSNSSHCSNIQLFDIMSPFLKGEAWDAISEVTIDAEQGIALACFHKPFDLYELLIYHMNSYNKDIISLHLMNHKLDAL